MRELALFAGAGGGILGGKLLGWRTVCAVEIDSYCRRVLLARQRDGILDPFPIWDDVKTFDGRPWRGHIDVISGGFPCQDISCAGKGAGITGSRSGLWSEMARIIGEVRPRFVFVENSPMLMGRGLAVVLGDLAQMRYDARWRIVSAADCGAPHRRDRVWILADSNMPKHKTQGGPRSGEDVSHADEVRWNGGSGYERQGWGRESTDGCWWQSEPGMGRVVDGLANRLDRLKALGNGQVPRVAALAWRILTSDLTAVNSDATVEI